MYSVIIPAFNEEACLPLTLSAVKSAVASVKRPGEVIVVDNNSTDRTPQLAKQFGATVIFEPINQISRARNAGAKVASGEYFIFLDADTFLTKEVLQKTLAALDSKKICGGGVIVAMEKSNSIISKNIFMLIVAVAHYLLNSATDCYLFCRADAFQDLGGFNEKIYATEEYWFSRMLKKWGKKNGMSFTLLKDVRIVTSSRKFDSPANFIAMLIAILVPFSIFFRSACRFWYKRPEIPKGRK